MPYAHISWSALRQQLAARLGDSGQIYWVDVELGIYLKEALRTFGLCSGFWRERGTITTSAATAFYDIPSLLSGSLLSYTVTDRDIIQSLQYSLLESATSQAAWSGTSMFTLNDLTQAIHRRVNQFLSDTGIVVQRSIINVASPPSGRETLDESIIDVRRVAWIGASPIDYYVTLWREDERMLTAADTTWSVNPNTPEMFSIMAPPPLQLQLAPPPSDSGHLELLTVNSVAALAPASGATVLGIPDDLTPAIKWGALADLLGIDGEARDPARAVFAEGRYQQYVRLARMLPVVIHAELDGVPLIPSTIFELDASTPLWQNSSGEPEDLGLAAPNLIALNPVPDGLYSITLDVVRKTPLPPSDVDFVQVGREQMDMILDYAEHLALFKVAGAEWHAADRQAENFITQSLTYNQRISAAARAAFSASGQSYRQKSGVPRRLDTSTIGVGALRGDNA